MSSIEDKFLETFGAEPDLVAAAPGRVNLIGEHDQLVLAGDLQVGPPTEGGEHPVRFALTTEAGLNDGLAFPFVYLAIAAQTESGLCTCWPTDGRTRRAWHSGAKRRF